MATLPGLVTYLFAGLIAVGFVALIAPILAWRFARGLYQDHELKAKLVVEAIQTACLAVAFTVGFLAFTQKDEWLDPSIAAFICGATWKAAQVVWDVKGREECQKLKLELLEVKALLDHAERGLNLRARLQAAFRIIVGQKVGAILEQVERIRLGQRAPSIKDVRCALVPKNHLEQLLHDAAVFLSKNIPSTERDKYNFRVGLYVDNNGLMKPMWGTAFNDRNTNPFTAYNDHAKHYRLDATETPAEVVRCIKEKRLIIVPDCIAEAAAGRFSFFHEDQKSYLRSMVACPIEEVCTPEGVKHRAAIVIDTDYPGYFRRQDEQFIRTCVKDLAARASLERALDALLARRPDLRPPRPTEQTFDRQEQNP